MGVNRHSQSRYRIDYRCQPYLYAGIQLMYAFVARQVALRCIFIRQGLISGIAGGAGVVAQVVGVVVLVSDVVVCHAYVRTKLENVCYWLFMEIKGVE